VSLIQSLYFIAVLPPKPLAERITAIKKDFAEHYGSHAALRLMPHITLQSPFKRSPDAEVEMHLRLQEFFESYPAFDISLNGFGCFDKPTPKSKVIYIDVLKNEQLFQLHKALMYFLQTELKFTPRETPYSFHPHITLGYRDLTPDNFNKAWAVYKDKPFSATFKIDAAYLLKHDYRQWQMLSRFSLDTIH